MQVAGAASVGMRPHRGIGAGAGASRGTALGRHAVLASQAAITPGSRALGAVQVPQRSVAGAAVGVSCSAEFGFVADQLHHLQQLASHLPVAYERIALPCSVQNCGDVVYRSTLDKAARGEDGITLTPLGASLILSAVAYLVFPTPGVLQGWFDTYIKAKTIKNRDWEKDDFKLTKKIGTGAFGTVWLADIRDPRPSDLDTDGSVRPVVVKKATEYGLAEAYMNERVSRSFPGTCAEYLGALDGEGDEEVWLVWRYEGDSTLADLVQGKNFPLSAEAALGLPTPGRGVPDAERRAAVLRAVMEQLFSSLAKIHSTGLVHRDVKPQNTIVTRDGGIKLIDLGAMADLRVGRNYQPKEFVLDPRFAAPEQFIMQTSTVVPEADWQAALLSPVVWALERPDKFDMYSCGIMLLQMAFPALRSDKGLIAFNKELEKCGFDLDRWRRRLKRPGRDLQEGFQVLDMDGGAGWDLAKRLVREVPSERWSARRCLGHPFVRGVPLEGGLADKINSAADDVLLNGNEWIFDSMAKSGTEKVGGLTEAQLDDLNDRDKEFRKQMGGRMAPRSKRLGTIAWWQEKQRPAAVRAAKKAENERIRAAGPRGRQTVQPPPPPPPPPPAPKGGAFSLPKLEEIREIIKSRAE